VLPSLWEAVVGDSEVRVFERDERTGKRVLTPQLRQVWMLKNRLGEERRACVGKHVRGRLALVSLELLPALYALTGRDGRADDFRDVELASLERDLAQALLETGPQTGPELRLLVAVDARAGKRALESLQRSLVVTQAGEQEQDAGWDAAVYDLLARRYGPHLASLPPVEEARRDLIAVLLRSVEEVSAADAAAVFRFRVKEAAAVLDGLVEQGRAVRRVQDETAVYVRRSIDRTDGTATSASAPTTSKTEAATSSSRMPTRSANGPASA
jgi:hypothetical protein